MTQELSTIARTIIDSNLYMVIGTADETGMPWVSPVYYSSARYTEFYWISSPEARHSHNIAVRPQVSIVIFDSQAPVGTGQAVYMSAVAEEIAGVDLDRDIAIYNGRFANPVERGVRVMKPEELLPPAFHRLYRATASEHWILDPTSGRTGDHRIRVSV
ncbi:MAG: pyridoxamine 5'-phosphate oxidase family protein [Chloroflexi bacterium]|nr:pyridoxamine 5'-phosphate oxidase family protein [Chloroflexota bacterium]